MSMRARRGAVQKPSGLDNEVLDRHVRGVGIRSRPGHLAADGERPALLELPDAREDQHVVAPQRDVGHLARHHPGQIQRLHFERQILAFAQQQGASREGVAAEPSGPGDQFADGMQPRAQFVHARAVDGSAHLHAVGEAVQHRPHGDDIDVLEHPAGIVGFADAEDPVLAARFADDAHLVAVGVAAEPAGILHQAAQALAGLHLVVHRTLHLARDLDADAVGRYDDCIALLEADAVLQPSFEQQFVEIRTGHLAAARMTRMSRRLPIGGDAPAR